MGWTHQSRKWRDRVRLRYKEETGSDDYRAPEFMHWVEANGLLDREPE